VTDSSLYLTEEVKSAFFGQMSEIANEVRNGVLFAGAAVGSKNSDCFRSPGDVIGFVAHGVYYSSVLPGLSIPCRGSGSFAI
jgi:hypothetical protein